MNSNSGGTGVAITAGTSATPVALGAGIYSVQNGNLSIGGTGTGHANFTAGTSCAPTGSPTGSCIYLKNGGLLNTGTTNFAAGNWYIYQAGASTNSGTLTLGSGTTNNFYINNPTGSFANNSGSTGSAAFGGGTYYFSDGANGFSSSGTGAAALTFAGGGGSNYYFFDPSGGGSTSSDSALNIAANAKAVFNPATYYIVNGALAIGSEATVTCPNCVVGGAGDTFVLTGTGSGTTLTNNIGTAQISSGINAPAPGLNAPGTACNLTTAGCYQGLLIYQDSRAPLPPVFSIFGIPINLCVFGSFLGSGNCNALDGGTNMNVTGAFYLPQAAVDFWGIGSSSNGNCVVIIANVVTLFSFAGSSSLSSTGCPTAGVHALATYRVALTQ